MSHCYSTMVVIVCDDYTSVSIYMYILIVNATSTQHSADTLS